MPRSEKTALGKVFSRKGLALSMLERRRGEEHVDLATGGWVDLSRATQLASWSADVENLGTRHFALYRTSKGALILRGPRGAEACRRCSGDDRRLR